MKTSFRTTLALACWLSGCGVTSPLYVDVPDTGHTTDAGTAADTTAPATKPPASKSSDSSSSTSSSAATTTASARPPCGTGPGCDPSNLGAESCESLGLGGGQLLCDPTSCTFILSLCKGLSRDASTGRPCGTGQGCNPDDLGGFTCSSLGLTGGTLACNADCTLDTSACTGGAAAASSNPLGALLSLLGLGGTGGTTGGTGGAGGLFGGGLGTGGNRALGGRGGIGGFGGIGGIGGIGGGH